MEEMEQMIEEVQQIVWALVDETATEEQVRRLESLVLKSAEARRTYVDCMTLHAELHCMFAPPQSAGGAFINSTAPPKAIVMNLGLPPATGTPQTT